MRFFRYFVFLIFFSIPVFAQQAGSLDPTFENRVNYGALYPIKQTWPLENGGLLCYQEGPNFFSGRKTGSFFKLKADGSLDTTYKTPEFQFLCFPGFCSCEDYPQAFRVKPDGEILILSLGNAQINNRFTSKVNFKISSQGILDTSLNQKVIDFRSLFSLNPVLNSGKIVSFSYDTLSIFKSNLEPDSLFFILPDSNFWLKKNLSGLAAINFLVLENGYSIFYLPYSKLNHTFNPIIPIEKRKGRFPISLEADKWGRIYEIFYNLDTLSGQVYHLVKRRFSNGTTDSSYTCQIKANSFYDNHLSASSDSLGFVFFQNAHNSQSYRRYDPVTGHLVDTVFISHDIQQIRNENELISTGFDPDGRWKYFRQNLNGDTLLQLQTKFGANAPIERVILDNQKRLIIQGKFSEFDGHYSSKIARVKPNGRVDSTFLCKVFGKFENPDIQYFDFWKGNPEEGILIAGRKRMGGLNRFLYKIKPDGKIDSSFASNPFSGLSFGVIEIYGCKQTWSGSIFLTVRQKTTQDSGTTSLIKLNSNGQVVSGFAPIPAQELQIVGNHLSPVLSPVLGKIMLLKEDQLAVELNTFTMGDNPPPCKSSGLPTITGSQYGYLVGIDTSGQVLPNPNLLPRAVDFVKNPASQMDQIFVLNAASNHLNALTKYSKITPYMAIDSSFYLQKQNGEAVRFPAVIFPDRFANFEIFKAGHYPTLISKKGDLFFTNRKTNPNGVIDTTFSWGASSSWRPFGMAEPDTSHLYVSGDFEFYHGKPARFLVRVHNQTSTVTQNINTWKKSELVLFPNPLGEMVNLRGWKPGIVLMVFGIDGKIHFKGEVKSEFQSSELGLKPGLYFWKAILKREILGGGKLITY